jgi:L-alanine-DL-glutamate epimerase-like enolase superfamily enzyme
MADDRRKMIADAERALHEFGIKVLCMKAGHPKGWREDVTSFIAIREAVGPDVSFGMDPNTDWTVTETLCRVRRRAEAPCDGVVGSDGRCRTIVRSSR